MLLIISNVLYLIFFTVISIDGMEELHNISISSKPPSPALEASLAALESIVHSDLHVKVGTDIGLHKRGHHLKSSDEGDAFDDAQEYEIDDTEYQVARGMPYLEKVSGVQGSRLHLSSVLGWLPIRGKVSSKVSSEKSELESVTFGSTAKKKS